MDETLKAAAVLNPPVGGRLSFGVRIARPTAASLAQWLPDVLMGAALGVFSAILAWQAGMSLDPMVLQTWDIWFEGDIGRIYENLTDRWSDHFRTNVHPLFSLLVCAPAYTVLHATGMEPVALVRGVTVAIVAGWVVLLFAVLRVIGCRRLDAVIFTGLAASSSAAMFWSAVPETYYVGSITMLVAVLFVTRMEDRRPAEWIGVLASVLTLSMTITNWMAGIAAVFTSFRWRRALQITGNALCLAVVLWTCQKFLFPSAQFFLGNRDELHYTLQSDTGGPSGIATVFALHSIVMPEVQSVPTKTAIRRIDHVQMPVDHRLSVQSSRIGTGSPHAMLATVLWGVLLAMGIWALCFMRGHLRLRLTLGLTVAGQLVLHLIYGHETFLYAMHFAPLLVIVAALSTLTRARWIAVTVGAVVLLLAAVNNAAQFDRARGLLAGLKTERETALGEISRRPGDLWPRGTGHVVLAAAGTREESKAYLEPGGSFSPAPGSFGLAIWLTDEKGLVIATGDTLPLREIEQRFDWRAGRDIPDVITTTPYFRAVWSLDRPGMWRLDVTQTGLLHPRAVIRSVGPAGGPVNSLRVRADAVWVNDRWQLQMVPAAAAIQLGEEGMPGWMAESTARQVWQSTSGWGYAHLSPSADHWTVTIADAAASELLLTPAPFPVVVRTRASLPDNRFIESLDAQVAHLVMSLVRDETRPGEPLHYPLAWQRDSAYIIAALARAGQLDVAKRLAVYLAEHDFYGGFGPEADAPGLALWALEEVAARANDAAFDRRLWPHVARKAQTIESLLSAADSIDSPVVGPVLPRYAGRSDITRVADPARNGLIVGRMDFQRPILFVNAVNYRGLCDAAAFAERLGHSAYASHWRAVAGALQKAWMRAFVPPETNNDRTYIASLWPTEIGRPIEREFYAQLDARWLERRDSSGAFRQWPQWTYFDVAETHQWLFVGRADRVWQTLNWLWEHQASPGLFTWWEGNGSEQGFYRWHQIRGWLAPPHVTPHYWTAAEMLMLQLDMLAYETPGETDTERMVVIGAGVPRHWLAQPISVEGVSLRSGRIGWSWDGAELRVRSSRPLTARDVRLGPGFPSGTPVRIEGVRA